MIELIPAIDIIDGQCVRLTRGDYSTQKVYASDPVDMALRLQDMGFRRLHVVDLDGARSRHVVNAAVLARIVALTTLCVDFGGGIKTDDDLRLVFDAGAAMATLGSIAVTAPDTVATWLQQWGTERFVLGADARNGRISINGWHDDSTLELMPFIEGYMQQGLRRVLCTDINCDGTLQGPSLQLYTDIMRRHPYCHLIASGGVANIDDIRALDRAGVPAVVFGKAMYEGRIDLPALLEEFPQQ